MKTKFNTNKSFEEVCKELEKFAPCVLGVYLVKRKIDKSIVYCPDSGFWGVTDKLDEVVVTVRKINSSTTHVCVEFHEKCARVQNDLVRRSVANKAFNILEKILKWVIESEESDCSLH